MGAIITPEQALVVGKPPPKVIEKRQLLGITDNKEYYREPDGTITWRVPDIREAVRAPIGRKLFGGDFSQIEIKIMAFLSGDPFLIGAVNKGGDFHCSMASEVYEIPYDEFYRIAKVDEEHTLHKEYAAMRSGIKTTVFGIPLILAALSSN